MTDHCLWLTMLLTRLLTLVSLSPMTSLSFVMTSLLVVTFVSFLVRVLFHSGLGIVLQIQVLFMVFIICDPLQSRTTTVPWTLVKNKLVPFCSPFSVFGTDVSFVILCFCDFLWFSLVSKFCFCDFVFSFLLSLAPLVVATLLFGVGVVTFGGDVVWGFSCFWLAVSVWLPVLWLAVGGGVVTLESFWTSISSSDESQASLTSSSSLKNNQNKVWVRNRVNNWIRVLVWLWVVSGYGSEQGRMTTRSGFGSGYRSGLILGRVTLRVRSGIGYVWF